MMMLQGRRLKLEEVRGESQYSCRGVNGWGRAQYTFILTFQGRSEQYFAEIESAAERGSRSAVTEKKIEVKEEEEGLLVPGVLKNTTVEAGTAVRLACLVNSQRLVSVVWGVGSPAGYTELPAAPEFVTGYRMLLATGQGGFQYEHSLHFTPVNTSQGGTFLCIARYPPSCGEVFPWN